MEVFPSPLSSGNAQELDLNHVWAGYSRNAKPGITESSNLLSRTDPPGSRNSFLLSPGENKNKVLQPCWKGPDLAMGRGRAPAGASRARICCSELLSLGI